jgi:hypothetical protein
MGGQAVAQSSDAGWEALGRELSARVAVFAPDWTESNDSDPGITFVELFGFLVESLLSRGDLSPHARARLSEVIERIQRPKDSDCRDAALTRNHYFTGTLLSADDLAQEQEYERTKHRRHNRLLHGVGIVRGLAVRLEPRPGESDPTIVVLPGFAISRDGEELVVCEPVTRDVCQGVSACYVTLGLVELPADPTPEGEHSRIEETAEVAVSDDVPPGHLAIARLVHDGGVWRSDPSFNASRVR